MSILSLDDSRDAFRDTCIPVPDETWKNKHADWLELIIQDMKLAGYNPDRNVSFSFNKSTFVSSLPDSSTINDPASMLGAFAIAFESSILLSSMSITVPMTTPSFTAIASIVVEPPSVAAAKIAITSSILNPTDDARQCGYIVGFRNACLALTYTVSGTIGGNSATLTNQGVV